MGFTKPIEQILFSYQGTFNVSKRYYTRRHSNEERDAEQENALICLQKDWCTFLCFSFAYHEYVPDLGM